MTVNRVSLYGHITHKYVSGPYGNAWVHVIDTDDEDFTKIPIFWHNRLIPSQIEPFEDGDLVHIEGELHWVKSRKDDILVVKVSKLRVVTDEQ